MTNGWWAATVSILLFGCPVSPVQALDAGSSPVPTASLSVAEQAERDEIYMLLAYAVVFKDWQTATTPHPRGDNVGAVLVDPAGTIVHWARNASQVVGDGTQHGELRLIRNHLAQSKRYDLNGHTIYTTLEPCAMCGGMMVLTKVARSVYGQADPQFGKALERLALDSRRLRAGFGPYPQPVQSVAVDSPIRQRLESGYAEFHAAGLGGMTDWLRSLSARAIYQGAFERLQVYQVRHAINRRVLDAARAYYRTVPDSYAGSRR